MKKIRRWCRLGRFSLLAVLAGRTAPALGQGTTTLTGRLTLVERGDRRSEDLAQAVVWLVGADTTAPSFAPVEMATAGKQFVPHLLVLPAGSTVSFPNHDPFSHNVFSLAPEATFDLGLLGRGDAKAVTFPRPGVVRVHCNVHAQMRGLVLVLEASRFTQPDGTGNFRLEGVPPGDYTVHAWHERGGETSQPVRVTDRAPAPLALTVDARGYRLVQHRDKNGQSYSDRSRRY